jgi:acetoin utilization deacetylase AcuC-like enzyme
MTPKHPVPSAFSESYFSNTRTPSMRKLPLVAKRAAEAGFAALVEPQPATRNDLDRIHAPTYVHSILTGKGPLSQCAFGYWSEDYRDGVLAINGGGYCTFNGLALVAALNPRTKVFVLDCDEHGGDGTAAFTKILPNLFNFSICGASMGAYEGPRSIVRTGSRPATKAKPACFWKRL